MTFPDGRSSPYYTLFTSNSPQCTPRSQWLEMIRILTRQPAFGELYQMVIEALHATRAFLVFLFLICFGASYQRVEGWPTEGGPSHSPHSAASKPLSLP